MKKILSILLAVLMVAFAVAGCGREKVKDKAWNLTMVNLETQAEQQMFQAVSEAAGQANGLQTVAPVMVVSGTYTGETKEDKPDGKGEFKGLVNKKIWAFEGEFKNGEVFNGKAKQFHENGQLSEEVEFKDGKANGKVKDYYPSGKLKAEGEMKDGKFHGTLKGYHENGKLEGEMEMKDGKFGGMKMYYNNGQLQAEVPVKNGKLHGKVKEYDINGKLKNEVEYENGKKVSEKRY